MDKLTQISKFLSYVLRHHPESIGIQLDRNGWVNIDTLLQQAAKHRQNISRKLLMEVVENNNKKRFTLSDDGKQIRAAQGHSTSQVQMQLTPLEPPAVLYHGTAVQYLDSIKAQGLTPQQRHHVHLSADKQTAQKVGQRHGKPVILSIDAQAMFAAGHAFYLSDNQVWLTDFVPTQYLK